MNVSYREIIKKAVAIVLMAVILVCMVTGFSYTFTAKADDTIIATGYVNYDVTSLRIRTAPVNGSVITKVDGGFKFDIYEEVNTSATYKWYSIGFYLNGEYTRGNITGTEFPGFLQGKLKAASQCISIMGICSRP